MTGTLFWVLRNEVRLVIAGSTRNPLIRLSKN